MATSAIPTFADTYNQWFANEMLPFAQNYTSANLDPANFKKDASGYYIATPDAPVWSWTTGPDYWAQKQALDQRYLDSVAEYNRTHGTNIQPDQSVLGAVQPNPIYRAPDSGGGLFGGIADIIGGAVDTVGDVVGGAVDYVKENPLQAAALAAGAYGLAGGFGGGAAAATGSAADAAFVAADASQLAAQGLSQAAIEQNLIGAGVDAFVAADAAQLALQGIGQDQMAGLLSQSSGGSSIFAPAAATTGAASVPSGTSALTGALSSLTPAQTAALAKAGLTAAGLLGGGAALGGLLGGGNAGTVSLPAQDRSGVSSGSAQYTPEYYAAIQSKYNQMMPQQPRDVTTELKNWYETKYAPSVTVTPKAV